MNKAKLFLLFPILLLGSVVLPGFTYPVHAATGKICLADPSSASSTTPCPTTPPVFNGPFTNPSQQIKIGVYASGSDALNGFDVILNATHTILKPARVDLSGSVLPGTPSVIVECLSGILVIGPTCSAADNIDTIHLAATGGLGQVTTTPTTGLLFTAIYNITGTTSTTGIPISFQNGCSSTSVSGGVCVTISNGTPTPDSETSQTGSFKNSTPPPFLLLSANPSTIGPVLNSFSGTSTITLTPENGWPGLGIPKIVALSTMATPGLSASIASSVTVSNANVTTTLSLSAFSPGNYFVTVNGQYTTCNVATCTAAIQKDTLVAIAIVTVIVSSVPDFSLTVSPFSLSFQSGQTGTATVFLASTGGLVGNVSLSLGPTVPSGLSAAFAPNPVSLPSGGAATAAVTFSSSTVNNYTTEVTATLGTITRSEVVNVTVLNVSAPDFTLSAIPTVVSVKPSSPGTSTIVVLPIGGFIDTVALNFISSHPGLACSLAPGFVTHEGSSTLSCSGSAGTYPVMVTGTSGTITHIVNITFNVGGAPGLVCVGQPGVSGCPSSPPTLVGPTPPTTQQLRVPVFISQSDALDGFDITLLTDHTILQPAGVDVTGSILQPNGQVLVECIGTTLKLGPVCLSTDTVDTLHIALVTSPGSFTTPPTTGLLFTAIYNITGTTQGTDIAFQTGCSTPTSVAGSTICVDVANGTPNLVPERVQSGSFSNAPFFSVSATPSRLSIPQGSSARSAINLTSSNAFTGSVSLTSSIIPTGPTASFSFPVLTVSAGGTNFTLLTVTAGSTVSVGDYNVTVTATDGSLSRTLTIPVAVTGRDFSIDAAPSLIFLNAGGSSNATIFLTSLSGFSGTIQLTSSVSPAGPEILLTSATISLAPGGTGTSILTIVAGASSVARSYTVLVTGTNGTLAHTVLITVNVADFNIIIFPDTIIVQTGIASSTLIQVNSQNGFTGVVTLSSSTPVGLTAFLSNIVLELPPGSNVFSSLTVTASRSTLQGNYTITVTGFSSGLIRFGILHVTVITPPPDFGISVFPSSLSISTGSSGTSTITLLALNGFKGAVTLAATSSPAGPALILNPTSVPLFNVSMSALTIIATNGTFAGSYVITVTATSSTVSHTMSIFLVVTQPPQPDFSLFTFTSSLAVPAGTNAGTSVTVTSINGFAGTVTLTVSVFPTGSSGDPIPFLSPNSIVLAAGGTGSSSLTISTFSTTPQQSWTVTVSGTSGAVSHFTSLTLIVLAPPDIPPTAQFTFTPSNPVAGQTVTFDGSASFDPDGTVQQWTWNFGDGFLGFSSIISHSYANPGNYTVTLTVRDNAGLFNSASISVPVQPKPPHDVSIDRINVSPTVAVSTQSVYIQVQLENTGSTNETVSLTAYYDGHVIQKLSGIFIQSCSNNFNFCYPYSYNSILWDTTGVPAGNYTISATVSLSTGEVDPTPTDNTAVGGTVAILPAPVVTVMPVSGPVGTKVLVQGSGFPSPQPFQFGPVGYIIVTFDDMSLGFTFSHNGTFSFTFDVPQAQTGPHQVKALDEYTLARGAAAFTVTATPTGNIAIVIDTGTIYFPGDTATFYVLTSFNGAAIGPSGLQLQLVLFRPDGTNTTLQAISFGTGLYRATYTISSTGQLGTYTILARAHESGPFDASALRSFEVKPTWLSQNGRAVIGATSLAGVIGLAAVAWKKGYLQRKKGDEFSLSF